jgi:di/tricarboxylate transporter
MTFEILFVLLALLGMVIALVLDKMRPGMVLFSVVVLFLCAGILTPKEMLEGFSNKGMMTVAMLFLVSEGIRQSGALGQIIKKLLPQGKTTVFKAQFRMLPTIAFISAFLNNTPVVVIFAPIIKRWAESVKLPATKFLIPLSYVTILGGICTLIGTSTNLVVHGMILEAGYEGFTMFELSKRLFGQAHHNRRILADTIQHHRILKLRCHFTDNMNGLCFEFLQMAQFIFFFHYILFLLNSW